MQATLRQAIERTNRHTDRVVSPGLFGDPAKPARVGLQVLVHQDRRGFVSDTEVHHACVRIDSAVEFVTVMRIKPMQQTRLRRAADQQGVLWKC